MQINSIVCLFALCLSPTIVIGQEWRHAAASMGQQEGSITLGGDEYGLAYSCAGSFGELSFFARGVHVASGQSVLEVDGKEIARGNTEYYSTPDKTRFVFSVEAEWSAERKATYKAVLSALAEGREAVWETPTGTRFVFPLEGSSQIARCSM